MIGVDDSQKKAREVLEQARQISKRLRPYDLALLRADSDVNLTCYLFRKLINDLWRNFGGDTSIGMPIEQEDTIAQGMSSTLLLMIQALGKFLQESLDKDRAEAFIRYREAVTSYFQLLLQAQDRLNDE
jgi:hypothetical protein